MEAPLPAAVPPRRHLVMEAAVVEAHQSLRMVAVKEGAIYSAAAVVPRPRLLVAVAKLRHPRLPVTAVVVALVVATMVAVASVAF